MSQEPPRKEKLSVANFQFDLLKSKPSQLTSDEVLFEVFAERNDISPSEKENARKEFFSKGQACFRASPLTKRYGWAVYYDSDGKMKLISTDSEEFEKLKKSDNVAKVKAMRNAKK